MLTLAMVLGIVLGTTRVRHCGLTVGTWLVIARTLTL